MVAFRKASWENGVGCLGPFSTDPACKLDVFGHDGHSFGVDGTQIGVLKQPNKVGLASLL